MEKSRGCGSSCIKSAFAAIRAYAFNLNVTAAGGAGGGLGACCPTARLFPLYKNDEITWLPDSDQRNNVPEMEHSSSLENYATYLNEDVPLTTNFSTSAALTALSVEHTVSTKIYVIFQI